MDAPLAELVATIYEASLDPSRWSAAMGRMESLVGAFTSHVLLCRSGRADVFATGPGHADAGFAQSYALHYSLVDPMPSFVLSCPTGRLVTDEDAMSKRSFLNTEFYSDWVKPQGMYSCLYSNAFRHEHRAAHLCLTRERGTRAFGPKETGPIEQLVAHIARAAEIHFRLSEAAEQRSALLQVVGCSGQEVLAVNRACKTVFASPSAEARLRLRDGLSEQGDGLRAVTDAETRKLRRLIARGFDALAAGHESFALQLPRAAAGPPISITMVPAGGDRSHVLLFVSDRGRRPASRASQLRRRYGLTASEARVADLLLAGESLTTAADQLGVAIGTVRNQLKQVFQKTGTHRQAELVGLLLRLPVRD